MLRGIHPSGKKNLLRDRFRKKIALHNSNRQGVPQDGPGFLYTNFKSLEGQSMVSERMIGSPGTLLDVDLKQRNDFAIQYDVKM
jgi:hypothetical protein